MTIQIKDDPVLAGPGEWVHNVFQGYNHDVDWTNTGDGTTTATYRFDVVPNVKLRVSATWSPWPNRGTGITYKVYDGDTLIWTQLVNQCLAPASLVGVDGGDWEDVCILTPKSSVLTVVICNTWAAEDGGLRATIADAVRVDDSGTLPAPMIDVGLSANVVRPGNVITALCKWKLNNFDPAGIDLNFSTTLSDSSTLSKHLDGAQGSTLTVDFTVPLHQSVGDYKVDVLNISMPFFVEKIPVRIRAGSLRLDPSRNVLMALLERSEDGADTRVLTAVGGSVSWGGPKARSLDLGRPMYSRNHNFIWWALNKGYRHFVDDADAIASGDWNVEPYWPSTYMVFGDSRQTTTSPTATMSYPFREAIGGTYELRTSVMHFDPSYTSNAVYQVFDNGELVETLSYDQTVSRSIHEDFNDVQSLFRLRTIGRFTVKGPNINIVVSNPSAGGTLVCDMLKIERIQSGDCAAIPPDAEGVVLNMEDRSISTSDGDLGFIEDEPILTTNDIEWFEIKKDLQRTLWLGYNKGYQSYNLTLWYANLFKSEVGISELGWYANTQGAWRKLRWDNDVDWTCDQDGNLLEVNCRSGAICIELLGLFGTGTSALTLAKIPRKGTARIRFTPVKRGETPLVSLWDSQGSGLIFGTPSEPVQDPRDPNLLVVTQTYDPPANETWGGLTTRTTYPMGIKTNGAINSISVTIDEANPPHWPYPIDSVLHSRLYDKGFETIRFMDAVQTVGSRDSQVADIPRDSRLHPNIPSSTAVCNIIAVHPIDPNSDFIRQWFDPANKSAVVEIEVDSTEGFSNGHGGWVIGLSDNNFLDTAGNDHPRGATGPGKISLDTFLLYVVKDEHTLVSYCQSSTNWVDSGEPNFITLAESHKVTGTIIHPKGIGVSFADIVRLCNTEGVGPWLNVPHSATDEYVAAMGKFFGANLRRGLKARVEMSNEVWNYMGFGFMVAATYYTMLNKKYQFDHSLPNVTNRRQALARRTIEVHKIFKDNFVKAGGDPNMVVRMFMGQGGWAGDTTCPIADYVARQGSERIMEECGFATYLSNIPLNDPYQFDYTSSVYDDLDIDGLVSILHIHQKHGGDRDQMNSHLSCLASMPYKLDVVVYESSYEHLCPFGTDVVERSTAAFNHPRIFYATQARLQIHQELGFSGVVQYNMDQVNYIGSGTNWGTFRAYTKRVGTGNPEENRNPYAADALAQVGGAQIKWSADRKRQMNYKAYNYSAIRRGGNYRRRVAKVL